MKKLICCLIAAILCMSGCAQAEETVRLHVIGETDWETDQAYKLMVRDWALMCLRNGTDSLEVTLNDRAEAAGHPRNITVETGVFPYPESEYTGQHFPAGDYAAIRIRIGRAEGRNWWGMLYPEEAGLDGDVIYYSAIVDWLLAVFGLE